MGVNQTAAELTAAGETVAVATVTDIEGSAPQDPGAVMLVRADGSTRGTIGGGTVEELTREAAVEAIDQRDPRTEVWELKRGGNTGMVCGGEMTVFINVFEGDRRLLIAGAGHIAVPLSEMAVVMEYDVYVVDDRENFADSDRFPNKATVFIGDYDKGITEFGITDNTAVVIASRSSTFDRVAARESLSRGAYYVGLVASETKAEHVKGNLLEDGVKESAFKRLYTPVGIEVGGGEPADIALSILGQLNRVRNGLASTI